MSQLLSLTGYSQTLAKLEALNQRLREIEERQGMETDHKAAVIRSYKLMASQYLKEIKLYEARRGGIK